MHQTTDSQIIEWIKNKDHSNLSFLEDCYKNKDKYIGYYYFSLDIKGQCTKEVFNEIVENFGGTSNAYSYLGDIALSTFNYFHTYHIAAGFYRNAIELDRKNASAHHGLYICTGELFHAISAIKLYRSKKDSKSLEQLLGRLNILYKDTANLEQVDWELLRDCLIDSNCLFKECILVLTYFYLNKPDKGLSIIEKSQQISLGYIEPYVEAGLLSKEVALTKVHDFEIDNLLDGDDILAYKECLRRQSPENEDAPSNEIIKRAFRAKFYEDVISLFEKCHKSKNKSSLYFESYAKYILSKLTLGLDIHPNLISYANKIAEIHQKINTPLFYAMQTKIAICKIKRYISKTQKIEFSIQHDLTYKQAIKHLSKPKLIEHNLYSTLRNELDELKNDWEERYIECTYNKAKEQHSKENSTFSIEYLSSLAIQSNKYEDAITEILNFYSCSKPTMTSENSLGVCYQNIGELEQAYMHYKSAIELMYASRDKDHVIISNFVNISKVLNVEISDIDLERYSRDFNSSIINSFQWNTFTSERISTLFKYFPLNINTIDAISNGYLYFPNKEQLNDPIEMPSLTDLSHPNLISSDYRICSFSNNENSMLMWSHYAQEHQGVMIEYWFGGELPDGVGISQVKYTHNSKRNIEKDLYIFNQYILTKNNEWAYEEEVRLFTNLSSKVFYQSYSYPHQDRSKINARIVSITMGYKFDEQKKPLLARIVDAINSTRPEYEPKVMIREAYVSESDIFSVKYRDYES
ncbi:DUF2971 domain-containing protein [Vibrio agarivorans]|uniref:DUF2971 domain-containing protein n=1 Tax=Vibrio agarivorans TaxID=153622 RepID=UPI002232ABD7|nr:DUF2971 domain-containing protein [Vibrio agarivorans]